MVDIPTNSIECTQVIYNIDSLNTKKKVKLNLKVQYMDEDDPRDNDSLDSPDVDKLDGDGDYMSGCDGDEDSDTEEPSNVDVTTDDENDSDYVNDDSDDAFDEFGPIHYRNPADKRFLLGFEFRHFGLDTTAGMDTINLRLEETTADEKTLHDNLEIGLVNALRNSSNKADKRKGKQAEGKPSMSSKAIKEKTTSKDQKVKSRNKMPLSKRLRSSQKVKDAKRRTESRKLKELIKSTVDQIDLDK